MKVKVSLSHVQLFATPWTVARQAPLFMEFSRQEDWSGLPFPSPRDLVKLGSSALQADFLPFEPQGSPSGHAIWHGQKKRIVGFCICRYKGLTARYHFI